MSIPRAMVLAATPAFVTPASAFSNGVPDGDDHPNVNNCGDWLQLP
jgi:hypothetical protein